MMASNNEWTPLKVEYQVNFEGDFGDARSALTIHEEHEGKPQTVFQKFMRSHIEEIKLVGQVVSERPTSIHASSRMEDYRSDTFLSEIMNRQFGYKNPDLEREDINVEGQRKWVRFGIHPANVVQSRLVIDVIRPPRGFQTQCLQVVLSKESDDDTQRWWFKRGMIWNKAHPGKVLAVDWDGNELYRHETKLGDLHLVDEKRTAKNQRWIYFPKDEVFESGVPGRYVIDCWHATKQFKEGATVIAHNDCRKPEQRVIIKEDPLNKFREKISSSSEDSVVEDSHIRDLIKELDSDNLSNVYEVLGISDRDVRMAKERADTKDPIGKAKEVFRFWRQTNGMEATRLKLLEALLECEYKDPMQKLKGKWGIEMSE